VAPDGRAFAVISSDLKKLSICNRATLDNSQPGDHESKSVSYTCHPIASDITPLNGQIEFSASGRYLVFGYGFAGSRGLAIAEEDGDWKARTIGRPQTRSDLPPFAFSADESLLAIPDNNNSISVIDPGTLSTKALLPTPSRVTQLAFFRDGTDRLVSLDEGVLRTWDWSRSLLLKEACRRWPVWLAASDSATVPSPLSREIVCEGST
jgi:hypothetical protein